MTHLRISGILLAVFVLAVSSLAAAQSKKQLDINSATQEEMVAIGIDKVAAQKIIDDRPYRNKTELVSRRLLTREQYDKLKDLIIAKQSSTPREIRPATR